MFKVLPLLFLKGSVRWNIYSYELEYGFLNPCKDPETSSSSLFGDEGGNWGWRTGVAGRCHCGFLCLFYF